LQHLHAMSITGVEYLMLGTIVVYMQATVGKHAIDIKDDEPDLPGLL